MFSFIKKIFGIEELDYGKLISRGAIIVDVRTTKEYQGGHLDQSINIPLSEISNRTQELKELNKPIIACCKSGVRSGNAASKLKSMGIEAYNGGGWKQVQKALRIMDEK